MKILVFGVGAIGSLLIHFLCKVGNNPECDRCESYIKEHSTTKRVVLFGFQNSAGHREKGRTFAGVLPTTELVLGGAHSSAAPEAAARVKRAFVAKGYKVTEVDDMYAYYMYHIAEIMPYILMSYKAEYDLKRLKRGDIKQIIKATGECFNYLKGAGIKVMPPKECLCPHGTG